MISSLIRFSARGVLSLLVIAGLMGEAFSLEAKQDGSLRPIPPSEVQQFCSNITAGANDAHAAWQAAQLVQLENQLKERIAELEAKRAELADLLLKRDAAMKKADEGVVSIYGKMRPDAAAAQLSAMDDNFAAAVLSKLNTRSASAILNEMEASRAARLTSTMTGAPDGKKS
jgi:flagellar motility protein MotE (MotC chaperone)